MLDAVDPNMSGFTGVAAIWEEMRLKLSSKFAPNPAILSTTLSEVCFLFDALYI